MKENTVVWVSLEHAEYAPRYILWECLILKACISSDDPYQIGIELYGLVGSIFCFILWKFQVQILSYIWPILAKVFLSFAQPLCAYSRQDSSTDLATIISFYGLSNSLCSDYTIIQYDVIWEIGCSGWGVRYVIRTQDRQFSTNVLCRGDRQVFWAECMKKGSGHASRTGPYWL
jgi:hypothetical protein